MLFNEPHYKNIYFEISGRCNARCKYCVTGQENINHNPVGKFVDIELFKKAITHLLSTGIAAPNCSFNLYNWGEPFMHPQFKDIVNWLYERNLTFALSTNGSIPLPEFSAPVFTKMRHITFSCCGFSQKSYDKIHGFSFEKITKNISTIIRQIRQLGFCGDCCIAFHIYKFNLHEISLAYDYAVANHIGFTPTVAFFNDFDRAITFLQNKCCETEATNDLYLEHVKELCAHRPSNYLCPQSRVLVIDENPQYTKIFNIC